MADEIIINGSESEEVDITVTPEGAADIPVPVTSDADSEAYDLQVETPHTEDTEIEIQEEEDPEEVETTREWREILSYLRLVDKPSINGVILQDDKSFEELGVEPMTNLEILDTFNRVFGGN